MLRKKIVLAALAVLLVAGIVQAAVDSRARDMIDSIRKGRNNSARIIDLYVADDATFMDDVVVRGQLSVTSVLYLVSNPTIQIPEQFSTNKGEFQIQVKNLATNIFDNDYVVILQQVVNDDASNAVEFVEFRGVVADASATSPDGTLELHTMVASNKTLHSTFNASGLTLAGDLAVNGDNISSDAAMTITAGGTGLLRLSTNVQVDGYLNIVGNDLRMNGGSLFTGIYTNEGVGYTSLTHIVSGSVTGIVRNGTLQE